MEHGGKGRRRHRASGAVLRALLRTLVTIASGALVAGPLSCGSSLPYIWMEEVPLADRKVAEAPIQPGDTITVFVQEQEGLSGDFLVGADGTYIQPIVGAVHVSGRTPRQVKGVLRERLQGILAEPMVSVSIALRRPIRIGVIGEVNQPGHFEIGAEEGVLAGLARAGGLNDFADEDDIFVVRRRPVLRRFRVRYRELMLPGHAAASFRLLDGDTIVVE